MVAEAATLPSGITPGDARTRVAVAWRRDDPSPLVANLLAAVEQWLPNARL